MNTQLKLSSCVSLLLLLVPVTAFAQKPELVVQRGHSGGVDTVAFSPDGRILASGGTDAVRLWDVATGMELRALKYSEGHAVVAFGPDGKTLVSVGSETIKHWDVATGTELRAFKAGSEKYIIDVALSPDGKNLACGCFEDTSEQGVVRLWDVSTGTDLGTLRGHSTVPSVAFSPDGKTLVSVDSETIKHWDVATGTELRALKGHPELVNVTFSPDRRILASVERVPAAGSFKLWDASTGVELRKLEKPYPEDVNSVAFSPDGKTLASGSRGDPIELWDVSTGKVLRAFKGHSEYVNSVAFSPDGRVLASGGGDAMVRLWDVATGTELRALKGRSEQVTFVAFSPDGKTLMSVETIADFKIDLEYSIDHQKIRLWDIATGTGLPAHKLSRSGGDQPKVGLSPDGKTLARSNTFGDSGVKIWDVSTGKVLRVFREGSGIVAFSPDGRILAGRDKDTVKLWNISTGKVLRSFKGHSSSVAFSPDGRVLASGGDGAMVRLWDITTGTELRAFKGHSEYVNSVAFSPDGRILASGSLDMTVKLWDVATRTELRTLRGHSTIPSVAFSPDGKTLVSVDSETIKHWDVATGEVVPGFIGHSEAVDTVAFSPDGRVLASGSVDQTIKLWEVGTGKELASLIALDESDWLVVTPDGLFDGSPATWSKMIWRAPQNTFDFAPVEAYFADFYYPGLLTDIFAGRRPKASVDIAQKDRRQPTLKLTLSDGKSAGTKLNTRTVTVRIDVSQAPADARDVRLFRNGSLIRIWRGDVLQGRQSATLEAAVPIVSGENRLMAYAFNRDNIKSPDATLRLIGADGLARKGTAHVLAIGINAYSNPQYNLRYAVADAQGFAAEIKRQQEKLAHYRRVEITPLLDKEATKANILRALSQLTAKAKPEDAVIVYFAGHGTARRNQFYLIPHDLGYAGALDALNQAGLEAILSHSISDRELEQAFERVDAGHILLVIDACNSGQALEAEEKRRGPMNSKGLAQLAYEKGMYILTAAQSFQAALEATQLGHGLLTFALIEEGLRRGKADGEPKDGAVLIREWLNYATGRVPQMQASKMKRARSRGMNLSFREEERGLTIEQRSGQRPRVFYRRELEAQPLVVAKPPAARPKD